MTKARIHYLRCLPAIICCVALCIVFNSTYAQTTMFGVTPNHSGQYNSEFPSDIILEKKWSFKTGAEIFSSAVIKDGHVFFGSDDSCMYAVDTLGIQSWKFKSNGKIRSTPIICDSLICFNNYANRFYALDSKNGEEIWSFETGGDAQYDNWDFLQSSPVYEDTVAYFGSGNIIYAINLKNGEQIWQFQTSGIVHSTPALNEGKLFFGCWDNSLYALDAFTGEKLWEFETNSGIPSSPSVVDSFVFIGSRDAKIYAVHANSGDKLWNTSFGGSWMPSSFAMFNDTIYSGSSDAKILVALNKTNGEQLYSIGLPSYAFSTPAFSNGTIFIGTMNGSLFCIDAEKRRIISRFDTDGHTSNIHNALNENGTFNTSVVTGAKYISMMLSTGSVVSTPVIENNIVYFGSADSCFYAVQDTGGCKVKFKVSNTLIDLGENSIEELDTSVYVKNIGDCPDTIEVVVSDKPSSLTEAFSIQPDRFYISPNDSVKVNVRLNTNNLPLGNSYTAKLIARSIRNTYNSMYTEINFTTPPLSTIARVQENKTDYAYPNPFNEFTALTYHLDLTSYVDIRIYNSTGQLVKILVSHNQEPGTHEVIWDGNDGAGNKLNSGLYYCSIVKEYSCKTIKILRLN